MDKLNAVLNSEKVKRIYEEAYNLSKGYTDWSSVEFIIREARKEIISAMIEDLKNNGTTFVNRNGTKFTGTKVFVRTENIIKELEESLGTLQTKGSRASDSNESEELR